MPFGGNIQQSHGILVFGGRASCARAKRRKYKLFFWQTKRDESVSPWLRHCASPLMLECCCSTNTFVIKVNRPFHKMYSILFSIMCVDCDTLRELGGGGGLNAKPQFHRPEIYFLTYVSLNLALASSISFAALTTFDTFHRAHQTCGKPLETNGHGHSTLIRCFIIVIQSARFCHNIALPDHC